MALNDDRIPIAKLIEACRDAVVCNEGYLGELDRAIGDGDHGINMVRGLESVFAEKDDLSSMQVNEALSTIGTLLVMNIGGASGPLYGTLLSTLGKIWISAIDFHSALSQAIDAVSKRGKSTFGDKTLLDVLYPVLAAVSERQDFTDVSNEAWQAAQMTIPLKALRGRASYLGERSVGHLDPGAVSCALLIRAICACLAEAEIRPKVNCA